jgi:eukaryotic-like serine/threonine-protein kinase
VNPDLLGGRFRVEREVGRGGAGVVYYAYDTITETPVALKVVLGAFGAQPSEDARFTREGRLLSSLHHPGIVRVFASGNLATGEPYIAMEWLEGEDVAQRLKRGGLDMAASVRIAAAVADALHAAHCAGIVHRDVKPSNIFLAQQGCVKLVDFGVASAEDVRITKTGAIVGTPAYMAPEQARGERYVDARADTYALGATLFEMIAGRPPHVGPTPIAILARLVTTPAPKLSECKRGVPKFLDVLMTQMLSVDPEERPASMAEIRDQMLAMHAELALLSDDVSPSSGAPLSDMGALSMSPQSLGSMGGQRLVTSILATRVPKGPNRQRLIAHLRTRGAEATELGGDAIVAHLGVKKSVGDEATLGAALGLRLAQAGAGVGVATGRTRIDSYGLHGDVVDRAAALSRDAQKGEVLTDIVTGEFLRGHFATQIRSDGALVVGEALGLDAPHLGGASASPFVGRASDLAQLVTSFERAVDDRTPIVATLTSRTGMGKTRLAREFLARVRSHADSPRVLVLRAEAFAKGSAFALAAALVRELIGTVRTETSDELAEILFARLTAATNVPRSALKGVAQLLRNEAELGELPGGRDALWIAFSELVLAETRVRPLVLLFEDAQWADSESLSWLDHLLSRAQAAPLFILLTARPEFWRENTGRFDHRDHTKIELRPLSQKYVKLLALALLGMRALGEQGTALVDAIAIQAAGSPLFAEELARLASQGKDASSAPTIEAAIQVQLDALDVTVQMTASRLSIFGAVGWQRWVLSFPMQTCARWHLQTLWSNKRRRVLMGPANGRFAMLSRATWPMLLLAMMLCVIYTRKRAPGLQLRAKTMWPLQGTSTLETRAKMLPSSLSARRAVPCSRIHSRRRFRLPNERSRLLPTAK